MSKLADLLRPHREAGFVEWCIELAEREKRLSADQVLTAAESLHRYLAEAIVLLEAKRDGRSLSSKRETMAGFSKLLRCYRDRKGLLTDLVVEAEQAWIALSFVVPDVVFDQLYRGDDWATIESWMRRVPILYWDWPGSEIREIYDTEKARWIEGSYGDDWQVVFDVIGAVAVVHRTFHEWSHGSASTDHAFLHHDNSLSRLYELEQVLFQVYSETPVDRHTGERTVARRMSPR